MPDLPWLILIYVAGLVGEFNKLIIASLWTEIIWPRLKAIRDRPTLRPSELNRTGQNKVGRANLTSRRRRKRVNRAQRRDSTANDSKIRCG